MFYTLYTSSDDYELTLIKPEIDINSEPSISEQNLCIICWIDKKNNKHSNLIKNYVDYYAVCTCNTYIHEDCLKEWYNKTNSCPICRLPIEYQPINTIVIGQQWRYIGVFIVVYNFGVRCVRIVSILSIIHMLFVLFYMFCMLGYTLHHNHNLDHVV
jgi:hypothetical protein